ncbi:MAG: transporter substrate-binding domain-containing protein [Proteobacteria bacterium]|nr:transporter substrate-binding domain-containing protein [Pseudomonadota bacterium]MBU1715284.1 transporter substrate-binding domain-containing protein [Pseudomonadota bacterium]
MNKQLPGFFPAILIAILVGIPVPGNAAMGDTVYKVAIDRDYAPYEFVDMDGQIKGFTPDLLREIGTDAGITFRFIPMDWPDAVAALEEGRIDLINMIRTPQRLGQYEFSEPHSYIKQAIFRQIAAPGIIDLASLAGHRVALQQNDIALEMLTERTDFTRQIVQGKAEGFLLLRSGKVDAFLAAEQPGLRLVREYDLTNVEPASIGLFPQDFCFAARKGNRALIDQLNSGLQHLKVSGRYDNIVTTWLALKVPERGWLMQHWRLMAGLIGALMILLAAFVGWSVMLRRAVKQQTRALRESRNFLNEAQRIAQLGSWEWDIESDTLQWSEETFHIFGIDPEKFGADFNTFIEAVHPDDRDQVRKSVEQAVSDGVEKWSIDYRVLRSDGDLLFLHEEARAVSAPDGRVVKRVGTVQDVTEQRQLEDTLRRINRKLKAISDCNQILMKAEEEQALLNDICTIICDEAGYRMAWVGYAENDEDKSIQPVAWAGDDSDHVAQAHVSWSADSAWGQGPAGMAIRTGEPSHVDDYQTDPLMAPWREVFLSHGYRSGIALPLKDEHGTVFGVLLIYSTEPFAVTGDEFKLLEELAGDLAFGITVLRTRLKRREVEEALRENQRLLLEAQHMAHIGNWWHDLITGEIFWSDEFFNILGIKPQKPTMELGAKLFHPEDLPILHKAMEESASGKMEHEHDFRIIRPDGEIRWIHNHWFRVNDKDGNEIKRVGTHQDITELKRAEEKLRQLNEELEHRVKERTAELEATNAELERMNHLFVGRELKMVELKERIKELEDKPAERSGQ